MNQSGTPHTAALILDSMFLSFPIPSLCLLGIESIFVVARLKCYLQIRATCVLCSEKPMLQRAMVLEGPVVFKCRGMPDPLFLVSADWIGRCLSFVLHSRKL